MPFQNLNSSSEGLYNDESFLAQTIAEYHASIDMHSSTNPSDSDPPRSSSMLLSPDEPALTFHLSNLYAMDCQYLLQRQYWLLTWYITSNTAKVPAVGCHKICGDKPLAKYLLFHVSEAVPVSWNQLAFHWQQSC